MSEKIQWHAPNIFATVLSVSSLGAAVAALMGYTQIPAEIFGKPTRTANTLVAIQCFTMGLLLASSVWFNFARSHLKFHGLGLIPLIAFDYSCGFTSNMIQNGIVLAICLSLGHFYENGKEDKPAALKFNMPTILLGLNIVILFLWIGSSFLFEVKDVLPDCVGQLNDLSYRLATSMACVYALPLVVAVTNNRAEQIQTCWAIICLFAVVVDLLNTDVDNSAVVLNGILFVIHAGSSAFASGSKSRTD